MSEKKLLVKFDSNYADEFDVEGFTIMTENDWEAHKTKVTNFFTALDKTREKDRWGNYRNPVEVYFGTNEQMIYETLDCYLTSFKVSEISDEEVAILQKHFGTRTFGMMCMIDDCVMDELLEEETSETD